MATYPGPVIRLTVAAAGAALLLAACGTAPVPVTPFPAEGHWQPGLVGLTGYGPSGLGPTGSGSLSTSAAKPSESATPNPSPSASDPSLSDPTQAALNDVSLQTSDITPGLVVAPIQGGTTVSGGPTFDLCGGSFPSEQLRTDRRQVAAYGADGTPLGLSTEAVLYGSEAEAAQAISEITAARKACPTGTPVSVGGIPTTYTFLPAPGPSDVPLVPADDRAIVHMTLDRPTGTTHLLSVYQRVGRLVVGLYALGDGPGPFDQTSLDRAFTLAGHLADRMRASSLGG